MSDPSTRGSDQKKCRHCDATFRTRHIADWTDVLRHYLDEHPHSDRLAEVVNGTIVEVDCQSCGESFLSDLTVGSGRLGADLHCPGCRERDQLRGLFAQELRATEAISSAVGDSLLPDEVGAGDSGGDRDV